MSHLILGRNFSPLDDWVSIVDHKDQIQGGRVTSYRNFLLLTHLVTSTSKTRPPSI